tara:strand:- start:3967 stop:5685 length:1719 start_codon:yes stop_codon:yes gene_type:complete
MIKKLNSNLINQIAAGEVVDDPSSIIKELIENSIDAKATKINISIFNSGIDSIIIKDNGSGMTKSDLQLSFKRFTTSKISQLEDLQNINTLGFRGEALASIASISSLSIKTFSKSDKKGYEIAVENDNIKDLKPSAINEGTIIDIKKLFHNVPARKKFLKSPNVEYRKIINIYKNFALIHPEIEFGLSHNDKPVSKYLKEKGSERISSIFGKEFGANVSEISFKKDNYKISGYIGNLSLLKKRKTNQFSYVNKRSIKNNLIDISMYNCYKLLLERGEYPFYLLNITCPPEDLDVNVHPKKLEIKFKTEHKVQYIISKSVSTALKNIHNIIPQYSNLNNGIPELNDNLSFTFEKSIDTTSNSYENIVDNATKRIESIDEDISYKNKDTKIWQIHNKYIITELTSGIVIIDQHVAHERILYESAIKSLEEDGMDSQAIIFPQTLTFESEDFTYLHEILPYLLKIGFKIRLFGENSIIVEGVPPELSLGKEKEIINNILDHYIQNKKFNSSFIEYMAATYACKAAIKAGDKLSYSECAELIDKLFITKYPYYCPHGRPVIVNLTIEELDKRFERH